MRRCILDKITSVTKRIELTRNAVLSTVIPAHAGTVVAARVLNAKTTYDTIEAQLLEGDCLSNVLRWHLRDSGPR